MAIKSTDIKEVTSYFCEKHQRNHNKGSKVFDTCFPDYIGKETPPAPTVPERGSRPDLATNPPSGRETGGSGKAGVVAKTKCGFSSDVVDEITRGVAEVLKEKIANYRATRWEWPDGHTAFFSPAEMLQFAKRIAIAQGKKWHWWNEKKRKKECKKMGVDLRNKEGQGDI